MKKTKLDTYSVVQWSLIFLMLLAFIFIASIGIKDAFYPSPD